MSVPSIGCLAATLAIVLPGLALLPDPVSAASHGDPFTAARALAGVPDESALPSSTGAWSCPEVVTRPGPQDREGQAGRRLPKVFSWLHRWARGFDIERSTTVAPLVYLRSPLLSGFHDPSNCPAAEAAVAPPVVSGCGAITASDSAGNEYTWLVPLPQLGARTAAELEGTLRERLAGDGKVVLSGLGGTAIELTAALAARTQARACEVRSG